VSVTATEQYVRNNIRSLDTVIKKKQFKFNAQVIQIPGLSK